MKRQYRCLFVAALGLFALGGCADSATDRSAEFQRVSNLLARANASSWGSNGQRNLPEAIRLWTEAANAGSPYAQYCLGTIYFHGKAGETNFAKAASWYRKAAEGGWGRAQLGLAILLTEGLGAESIETRINE